MSEIWMDVDAAVTVPCNKFPLVDATDGKTLEDNTIAYDAAGIEVYWNFVTTAGAITCTPITPTTGGDYDWSHVDGAMYKIEIPATGGASANNDAEGFGWITGKATACLPFAGPVIGFRAAGLNNVLIDSAYSATRGLSGTALPDAAADAAGGLPISDAGALDLDTKLAATNEVTAARMGALTDWIDGGRIDLVLDAILANTGTTLDGKLDTIDGIVDSILEDTGTTLPGILATIAGYIDTEITSIEGKIDTIDTNMDTLLADWTDGGRLDLILDGRATPADVNTQVLDVLNVDTFAEPGQGAPAATTTLVQKIGCLYKSWRNKITNDGTDIKLYADDGTTVDQKASIGESGGTVTRGEFGTGA